MSKVVTFGEIMMRLSPPGYARFIQTDRFDAIYGGAEANVAISLANYGKDVSFVTRLPQNAIGDAAINSLRRYGVDTSLIVRGGDRVGIYFAEKGSGPRGSAVIYDRAGSAIQTATRSDFNWDAIFDGAIWFHFTGITAALGPNMAEICLDACIAARDRGVKISCDLNYRKMLWTKGAAGKTMGKLCEYTDVCIANEEDASIFGIHDASSNVIGGKVEKNGYVLVAQRLLERFNFDKVAITLRSSKSASDNDWEAILLDGDNLHVSRNYSIRIVDRIGSGDAFAAGLIYCLLEKMDSQHTIEFAAAAGCLKHSIEGDFNLISAAEVAKLVDGDTSGRVNR